MADSLNMVLDCTSSRGIILFLCFTRCACIPIIKLTFGDNTLQKGASAPSTGYYCILVVFD